MNQTTPAVARHASGRQSVELARFTVSFHQREGGGCEVVVRNVGRPTDVDEPGAAHSVCSTQAEAVAAVPQLIVDLQQMRRF